MYSSPIKPLSCWPTKQPLFTVHLVVDRNIHFPPRSIPPNGLMCKNAKRGLFTLAVMDDCRPYGAC